MTMASFIKKTAFLFVVFLLGNTINLIKAQCMWDLNADLPINTPVYRVTDNASLIIPTANGLFLPTNNTMTLACPGGASNTIMGIGLQELNAVCVGMNVLIYNNQVYSLKNLYCTYTVTSNVVLTGIACGTGEIVYLGYNTSKGLTTLITVCYDRIRETVLNSRHTINGKAIAAAQIDNKRPSFKTSGLTYGTTTANCYRQADQLTRFTTLLGSAQANLYITSTSYLARGHISPDGDFVFSTWAWASYFFVNVAPQWQQINAGNWLRVENLARDIASAYQEDITSMSGVFDVLQLPNGSGQLTDIYLMNNQLLRVPKWFWKIVFSPLTGKGIAMVTSNNPFLTSISPSSLLCPDICADVSLTNVNYATFSKGYTYCCDVNALFSALSMTSPFVVTANITGPY